MKKIIVFLGVLLLFCSTTFATKHTIRTFTMSFSPGVTTAKVGDTIEFIVGSGHTSTQVERSTWEANLSTPLAGGFNYSSGTTFYVLKPSDAGTIYFVCIPHISMGMKAAIIVQDLTSIKSINGTIPRLNVFPSLVKKNQTISIELPGADFMSVRVYTISGAEIKKLDVNDSRLYFPANFERGIYLVRVTSSNGKVHTQKIIVE